MNNNIDISKFQATIEPFEIEQGMNKPEAWTLCIEIAKRYNNYDKLIEALRNVIKKDIEQYEYEKHEADWFNNNMPNVGQSFDYRTYKPLAHEIQVAQQLLQSLEQDI